MEWHKKRMDLFRWIDSGNSICLQVSCPRSGRNWLRYLISESLDRDDQAIISVENCEAPYHQYVYLMWHITTDRPDPPRNCKYISLIRDPRDVLLSRAYSHIIKQRPSSRELTNEDIEFQIWRLSHDEINSWVTYHEKLPPLDPLVIQYEYMCLQPEKVITQVLDFLNLESKKTISEIVKHRDETVVNPYLLQDRSEGIIYQTGMERYNDHCLKWQKCEQFTRKHNEKVWEDLAYLMEPLGYTKDGHNLQLIER